MEHNALERGREDIALLARQRRVELSAAQDIDEEGAEDPVRHELWRALHAYEQVLGRTGTRTRQMIRNRGLVAAADRMVQQKKESAGFARLAEAGLLEHAWESVVLRHPGHFSSGAIERARERLRAYSGAGDPGRGEDS